MKCTGGNGYVISVDSRLVLSALSIIVTRVILRRRNQCRNQIMSPGKAPD